MDNAHNANDTTPNRHAMGTAFDEEIETPLIHWVPMRSGDSKLLV